MSDRIDELALSVAIAFRDGRTIGDSAKQALRELAAEHERSLDALTDTLAENTGHLLKANQLAAEKDRDMKAMTDTAQEFSNGLEFYRDLVHRIGELFGDAARTSDDGSVQQDILALKVPELVEKALSEKDAQLLALQQVCEKQREALRPLDAIAQRFSDSDLDEARPTWGDSEESAKHVELVASRGGKGLLTLGDCFAVRDALRTKLDLSLLEEVRKALKSMSEMPNYDQDNEHRLRYAAKKLLTKLGHE